MRTFLIDLLIPVWALPTLACLLFTGCMETTNKPVSRYEKREYFESGQVKSETVAELHADTQSADPSELALGTNGAFRATMSGAQPIAEIKDAEGRAAGKTILYACIGILAIISGVALFLPDRLVTNSDALLGIACAGGLYAIVTWADASSKIMSIAGPVVVIAFLGYIFWRKYIRNKSPE